ncbi:MAG TPA: tRNA uridine(34) 5-carboxymethylaminomethyl modification radical SAM/GNAT enzyme Elp3 [Aggregatilineaceae bacterium]|nr:tRNA uridine(34) 5-carboxymethylaminomethyl modification radical SAM/GNAT enzyme Elp3 [Aggregatilineaceae bacterium]
MSKRTRPALDLARYRQPLAQILAAVAAEPNLSRQRLARVLKRHPKDGRGLFSKDELIAAYRALAGTAGVPPYDEAVVERLRMKPVRTLSGVTPVTVLTKPYPCPGECVFCPNDVRMPKSYLSNEPGAQRAEQNSFDPYLQTYSRLAALRNTGHPTNKIELIILGGTWSFYPETYQVWFVKRVFDALHDFGDGIDGRAEVWAALRGASQLHPEHNTASAPVHGAHLERTYNQLVQSLYRDEMRRSRERAQAIARGERERTPVDEYATWNELEAAQRANEHAACRCVGLVIETRPDNITPDEVIRIRRLGATKVQIGIQSLSDEVLRLNRRGHTVEATRRAIRLLRLAGFKIYAHWMANLYGSSPDADIDDYRRLFADPDFRPDELKIYPCSLIESAELMRHYESGVWRPYTHDELVRVLSACFLATPEYCRLTRVVRDIPSTDIVTGEMTTNFRQVVEAALEAQGQRSADIRAREIRQRPVEPEVLALDILEYTSSVGDELFLQFITPDRRIVAFLRLSLPAEPLLLPELAGAAMIREVHVYGQSLAVGDEAPGRAQHSGLGARLIEEAAAIAAGRGYERLAVISAVGTRAYYRKRGFYDGALYQLRDLSPGATLPAEHAPNTESGYK